MGWGMFALQFLINTYFFPDGIISEDMPLVLHLSPLKMVPKQPERKQNQNTNNAAPWN